MITVNTREDFLKELSVLLPAESKGVEIGVLHGGFSEMILKTVKPRCLFLIDPYEISGKRYNGYPDSLTTAYSTEDDYQGLLKRFESEIKTVKVIVLRAFSYESVKNIGNNLFDFVYIDGSHLYEDVKRDLNDWLPKLKDGGLMCGHDCDESGWEGVFKAVNEFIKEQGFEMILLNEYGGDFALKKKP